MGSVFILTTKFRFAKGTLNPSALYAHCEADSFTQGPGSSRWQIVAFGWSILFISFDWFFRSHDFTVKIEIFSLECFLEWFSNDSRGNAANLCRSRTEGDDKKTIDSNSQAINGQFSRILQKINGFKNWTNWFTSRFPRNRKWEIIFKKSTDSKQRFLNKKLIKTTVNDDYKVLGRIDERFSIFNGKSKQQLHEATI